MAIFEQTVAEDGRIVKGVNTTQDVSTDEIKTQAAKFGNLVDVDGLPIYTLREDEDEDLDEGTKSPIPVDHRPELEKRFKALFSSKPKKKRP